MKRSKSYFKKMGNPIDDIEARVHQRQIEKRNRISKESDDRWKVQKQIEKAERLLASGSLTAAEKDAILYELERIQSAHGDVVVKREEGSIYVGTKGCWDHGGQGYEHYSHDVTVKDVIKAHKPKRGVWQWIKDNL